MTVDTERTPLQEECYRLLQSKQYKSCEILARMELSTAEKQGRDARVAWSLLGECSHATQQYHTIDASSMLSHRVYLSARRIITPIRID
jgi:hypothetical protein